ncbi:MAG: C40 family peptidase [Cytophagaceae bacterium]|nr:C40 family peptidase [Cytophagaceae bacterium]MDW8457314.1 C40 family peptidase [Cytophagaceae bacterium]
MKGRMIFILCVAHLCLHAQSKYKNKIEKLYINKKYDACIKLCLKAEQRYKRNTPAYVYFYRSLSWQEKYTDEAGKASMQAIKKSIDDAIKGIKKDKDKVLFSKDNPLYDTLINRLRLTAIFLYHSNQLKESKYITGKLASAFKDTTELYHSFFINYDKLSTQNQSGTSDQSKLKVKALTKQDSVVHYAVLFLGYPYSYGSEGPDKFDCSGFIKFVFKHVGISLPHNANMISESENGKKISESNLRKGDLILFGEKRAGHVAMYISEPDEEPKIIHCVSRGVCIDRFSSDSFWGKSKIYCIKRFF